MSITPKFKINNSYESPLDLNYDLLGLHKYEYIEMVDPLHKGEMTKVEYYKTLAGDPNNIANYSNLILTEHRSYTRDGATALLIYRDQTIEWYLEDGTIGETKKKRKFYQLKDSIEEGQTRRDNIITFAKLYLLQQIGLANGQFLLAEITPYITTYLQGNHQPLLDALAVSPDAFWTPTIRATTIAILTF